MIISTNGHSLNGTSPNGHAPNGVKAIETEYNGYRFRSRLEARWAVFFDALGVKYQYEPEGFELDGGERYLPDFWLPKEQMWVEIKPELPDVSIDRKSKPKAELFCLIAQQCVWLIGGDPVTFKSEIYMPAWQGPRSGWSSKEVVPRELQMCMRCDALSIAGVHCPCSVTGRRDLDWNWQDCWDFKVKTAARLARSARFEFGATPSLPIKLPPGKGGTVYIAGKVKDDWRLAICHPSHHDPRLSDYRWSRGDRPNSKYKAVWVYGGPTITTDHDARQHGLDRTHGDVLSTCLAEIANSDVVFAYINSDDTHGTLVEIGYAKALGKPVFVAFDDDGRSEEAWFAGEIADGTYVADKPQDAWRVFENWWNWRA